MTAWLGHRDLCPIQWGRGCDCPCPSCDQPLDVANPKCPQFAHRNVGKTHVYPEYLPTEKRQPQ
jgi:hypothetical protein